MRGQRGQVLPLVAAVFAFLFVPLSIFLIDSALVEVSYAQLGETLQAAVEDGASMIDQQAYRQSGGQRVVLDRAFAQQICVRQVQMSGLPGLDAPTVTATDTTVTARATIHVSLMIVGSVSLTETRSSTFVVGS